jgi:putative MFS transporter
MDNAKFSPLHRRVIALITAGFFLDLVDVAVFGSLVPDMVRSNFATAPELGLVISATLFGTVLGSIVQGELTDRFGRKVVYQFNLLIFGLGTIACAFAPNVVWLAALRFIAGIGLGAETPLCFAYAAEYSPKNIRGRVMAFVHMIGGAASWPSAILFALAFRDTLGWRGIFMAIGIATLVVWVLRFSLPESPRWLATHGKGQQALDTLKRMGIALPPAGTRLTTDVVSDSRSDPYTVVFGQYRKTMLLAILAFFFVYFVVYVLASWMPTLMNARGFSITKALTFTLGMTLAYPCSSAFMMYSLDQFGRLKTCITALIAAAIVSIVFVNSVSETMLLVVGFIMFFCVQTGTNSMVIYTTELFPTNARGTGLGTAFASGRLGATLAGTAIVGIQAYGIVAVFVVLSAALALGALSVYAMGRETKGESLDAIAPPTG